MTSKKIILFDGVCNLCEASVQFIIERDKNAVFKFASLQSSVGEQLLLQHQINPEEIDSVVLIDGDKAFLESTAALKIARYLGLPYNIFPVFLIVPKPIRNAVYRFIAKNRYKWFGKKESCMLPSENLKMRFLD